VKSLSKKSVFALALLSGLATAQISWAGWGAIACSNNNGACTWVSGQPFYQLAADTALNRCNYEYGNCTLRRWEHNACVSEVAANGNVAQACF
jgi:hypothetical protein